MNKPERQRPAGGGRRGAEYREHFGQGTQPNHTPAKTVLQRIEGVQP